MSADSARARIAEFGNAVDRLGEALRVPRDQILALDGTIQRFEFVFELGWKAIKGAMTIHNPGVAEASPRGLIKEAFALNWIDDDAAWIALLEARNETSHTYKKAKADQVYDLVSLHYGIFPALLRVLRTLVP